MTDEKNIAPNRLEADKFEQHYRQQLSALMDGALPPDEARFLLRRLQHDADLAECLDRWHMAGDALRGQAQAIVCAGFAQRVAAMVASEPASSLVAVGASHGNGGGLRWAGGVALAASVALVAVLVTRQPTMPETVQAPSTVAEASMPSDAGNAPAATDRPATPAVAPPAIAAESIPATVVATASVPRRDSIRRGNRSQSQRAPIRAPARSQGPMVATAAPQGEAAAVSNVFDAAATTRPWPSAVFPQTSGTGSFNVDYGNLPSARLSSPTFYPFEPRLPETQRDTGEAPPDGDSPSP